MRHKQKTSIYILFLGLLILSGCKKDPSVRIKAVNISQSESPLSNIRISTDKATYKPNSTVVFTLNKSVDGQLWVQYKYLDKVLSKSVVTDSSWSWTAPSTDFRGYMVEIYQKSGGKDSLFATIAIDVSSNWKKFPRYGFLSNFSNLSQSRIESTIKRINRYHINGLQFYDWQYEHQKMLAGSVSKPDSVWKNIGNDRVYLKTVKSYIKIAHQHNIKCMFYDLVYGALDDAASDGVSPKWYLYTDKNHQHKKVFKLPKPQFRSYIYLLDPSNIGWQNYMNKQIAKVYSVFSFDGYHMDQLGNLREKIYTYKGKSIDVANTFKPFIESVKQRFPQKHIVMNAVNQYGQKEIASAPTDFLYTEVWNPNKGFKNLAKIVKEDERYTKGSIRGNVLAAYVNRKLSKQQGYFNTPAVLMTDAVIFAFGGSHIELGDHMLGREYFPNNKLAMKADLKKAIIHYYDFLVGYENLLRGTNGTFNNPVLSSAGQIKLNQWPPQIGQVSIVGKKVENREVIHLLNYTDATTLNWRDNNGTQAYPSDIKNIPLTLSTGQKVKKIWYATPDHEDGASEVISFTQSGNKVSFTLPFLKYWDMIVVEY